MRAYSKWFPSTTRPARPGVYEIKYRGRPWYRLWTGKQWRNGATTPATAARAKGKLSSFAEALGFEWRGLARKPK